jgi:catechol 2,3-dioxygenase-like lactoylglutathione lyase family enzyme
MINHITFYVSDMDKTKAFFEKALRPLGYKVVQDIYEDDVRWVGLAINDKEGERDLWFKQELGTQPSGPLSCLAFTAADKDQVQAFYETAIKAGGKDNGKPGYRPQYSPGYYSAFVLDPDGNNIEAVFDNLA